MDKTQVVMEEANGVLDFWFGELSPEQWFKEDAALDKTITSRFSKLRAAAIKGELWPWRATATGRLAEIILLDQFSRNIHRNDKDAFSADSIALVLAHIVNHSQSTTSHWNYFHKKALKENSPLKSAINR